jgi:N-acetylglucosaminyldiphosphoundecaprenol N-acetyl-beta-D-mannosaminyltransferase
LLALLESRRGWLRMPRITLLKVPLDVLTRDQLLSRIRAAIEDKRQEVFSYINIHAVNIAGQDKRFRAFLQRAATVYCDGEGVRLGARILGIRIPPRIVLTYIVWDICAEAERRGFGIYLLGATEESVADAVVRIKERFPAIRIAGFHHGYFSKTGEESDRVAASIRAAAPDILFVGFGMPTQEAWIEDHCNSLNVHVVMPCGSMIDYVAGHKGLAPAWMSEHGMEWLYRLFQEPGRLWKRYLIGNPLFFYRIIAERLNGK